MVRRSRTASRKDFWLAIVDVEEAAVVLFDVVVLRAAVVLYRRVEGAGAGVRRIALWPVETSGLLYASRPATSVMICKEFLSARMISTWTPGQGPGIAIRIAVAAAKCF